MKTKTTPQIKARLEYLRDALRNENISYGELAELKSSVAHIEPGDVELLEAAGVPEFTEENEAFENARRTVEVPEFLIAAAPELLAALELCAAKLEMWPEGMNPEFFPSLKSARAAIAKAKGTP